MWERQRRSSQYLSCWDPPPHVFPVDVIVFFVGVVKQPLCKVLSPHGVHTFGELQELHLLDFSLQVLHEPEGHMVYWKYDALCWALWGDKIAPTISASHVISISNTKTTLYNEVPTLAGRWQAGRRMLHVTANGKHIDSESDYCCCRTLKKHLFLYGKTSCGCGIGDRVTDDLRKENSRARIRLHLLLATYIYRFYWCGTLNVAISRNCGMALSSFPLQSRWECFCRGHFLTWRSPCTATCFLLPSQRSKPVASSSHLHLPLLVSVNTM